MANEFLRRRRRELKWISKHWFLRFRPSDADGRPREFLLNLVR